MGCSVPEHLLYLLQLRRRDVLDFSCVKPVSPFWSVLAHPTLGYWRRLTMSHALLPDQRYVVHSFDFLATVSLHPTACNI